MPMKYARCVPIFVTNVVKNARNMPIWSIVPFVPMPVIAVMKSAGRWYLSTLKAAINGGKVFSYFESVQRLLKIPLLIFFQISKE